LKNILIVLGCIAFGGLGTLDGSVTSEKAGINGIIAFGEGDSDIEVESCADGIDLGTPFLIGSVSKQFTGFLALRHLGDFFETDITTLLTEDEFQSLIGGLSECVRSFLWPELRLEHLAGVTVENLLTHYSRINYGTGEKLTGFLYQNLNFDLIGLLLGKQTGRPYEELAHGLFREADMTDTFLQSDFPERELFDRLEGSLKIIGRDPGTMKMDRMTKVENPAGGIVSTARDLLKWNRFLYKNGYYKKLVKYAKDDCSGRKYGFGIVTNDRKSFYMHDGCVPVAGVHYSSFLLYAPNTEVSVIGFQVIDRSEEENFDRFLRSVISSKAELERREVGL
jgi:CubicO group peptidase (beta-lactamase class C family)